MTSLSQKHKHYETTSGAYAHAHVAHLCRAVHPSIIGKTLVLREAVARAPSFDCALTEPQKKLPNKSDHESLLTLYYIILVLCYVILQYSVLYYTII